MSIFSKFFKKTPKANAIDRKDPVYVKRIRNITCTLMVAMAKADNDFSAVERNRIHLIFNSCFLMPEEEIISLLDEIEAKDLDEQGLSNYLKDINDNFHFDEKYDLLKNLYTVIYADLDLSDKELKLLDHISKSIKIGKVALETLQREVKKEGGF